MVLVGILMDHGEGQEAITGSIESATNPLRAGFPPLEKA